MLDQPPSWRLKSRVASHRNLVTRTFFFLTVFFSLPSCFWLFSFFPSHLCTHLVKQCFPSLAMPSSAFGLPVRKLSHTPKTARHHLGNIQNTHTMEVVSQQEDRLILWYMAGQVDRRLCPQGLWLGDLLLARIAAMHVWAHISSHQESFLVPAHPSKIWHHDASTRTICVGVENKILFVGVRACECTRVRPALRVTTNVSACECKFRHNVWDSPRATRWLGVTALRGRERWSDWHEGVYGKQEQGLAGRPAITQECTLVSSSFFFLFFCMSLGYPPFDTPRQRRIVTLTRESSAWWPRQCVAAC